MRQALGGVRRRLEFFGSGDTLPAGVSDPRRSNRRGTGSDRVREGSESGVAVATPLPEPRVKTDRRHTPARADRIHSALHEARSLLDAGDLDSALAAGEKALALDDTNPEALEVERTIRAAAVRRRTRALLSEVRSLMRRDALEEAQHRLEEARGFNAELAECALVDSELQARRAALERRSPDRSGAPQTTPRDKASAPGYLDETVLSPPRLAPGGTPRAGAATVIAPSRQPSEQRAPASRVDAPAPPPSASRAEQVRKPPERFGAPSLVSMLVRHRRAAVAAAIVLALGAAVAVLVDLLRGTPAVSLSGTVLIDAVPWGTVMAVRSTDGREHTLPPDASTPLLMTVPVGSYDVTVAGPVSGSESRRVRVDVTADGLASAPVVLFPSITVEEYFEQYLKTPTEAAGGPGGPQNDAPDPISKVQP